MNLSKKSRAERIIYRIKKYKLNFVFWFFYYALFKFAEIFNIIKYHLIKISKEKELTVKVNGHVMYFDPNDMGIGKDLILNTNREELSQFMLDDIKNNDSIIDIGGNIGYYALKEARIVKKNGSLCVIEPVSNNVSWLKKNLDVNDYPYVKVYKLAIGDENNEIYINVSRHSNLSTIVDDTGSGIVKKEKVRVTTLDSFISKNKIKPTFIRMDVEGYEYEILAGARKILVENEKLRLMIEVHPLFMGKMKYLEFMKLLKNNGFESKYVVFDNIFYPYAKMGSLLYKVLLFLNSRFSKRAELVGTIHKNMSINDLMNNDALSSGELGCPHVLFEKQI